jgi:hypothetical protein
MAYHACKRFTPIFINTYTLYERGAKWVESLKIKMFSAFVFVVLLH